MQKILLALIVSVLASFCTMPAWAERNFPQTATRGNMKAYKYPAMKIGDNVYRLSPGSRIFNEKNLIIMPASLQTQAAPVMFQLDTRGDLAKVWLLTADEALRYPAPPDAIPVNPPPSR